MKMKANKVKQPSKYAAFILLFLGAFIMLIPFIWMLLTSFKTYKETVTIPVVWLPANWNLDNLLGIT